MNETKKQLCVKKIKRKEGVVLNYAQKRGRMIQLSVVFCIGGFGVFYVLYRKKIDVLLW